MKQANHNINIELIHAAFQKIEVIKFSASNRDHYRKYIECFSVLSEGIKSLNYTQAHELTAIYQQVYSRVLKFQSYYQESMDGSSSKSAITKQQDCKSLNEQIVNILNTSAKEGLESNIDIVRHLKIEEMLDQMLSKFNIDRASSQHSKKVLKRSHPNDESVDENIDEINEFTFFSSSSPFKNIAKQDSSPQQNSNSSSTNKRRKTGTINTQTELAQFVESQGNYFVFENRLDYTQALKPHTSPLRSTVAIIRVIIQQSFSIQHAISKQAMKKAILISESIGNSPKELNVLSGLAKQQTLQIIDRLEYDISRTDAAQIEQLHCSLLFLTNKLNSIDVNEKECALLASPYFSLVPYLKQALESYAQSTHKRVCLPSSLIKKAFTYFQNKQYDLWLFVWTKSLFEESYELNSNKRGALIIRQNIDKKKDYTLESLIQTALRTTSLTSAIQTPECLQLLKEILPLRQKLDITAAPLEIGFTLNKLAEFFNPDEMITKIRTQEAIIDVEKTASNLNSLISKTQLLVEQTCELNEISMQAHNIAPPSTNLATTTLAAASSSSISIPKGISSEDLRSTEPEWFSEKPFTCPNQRNPSVHISLSKRQEIKFLIPSQADSITVETQNNDTSPGDDNDVIITGVKRHGSMLVNQQNSDDDDIVFVCETSRNKNL